MNMKTIGYMAIAAAIGIAAGAGCRRQTRSTSSEREPVAERTGSALDRAADRTAEAGRATGEAVKDAGGRVIERTGELLEDAGEALERTGSGMQSEPHNRNP